MKQLEQLRKQVSVWHIGDIESEVFSEFELFQEQCINKNSCFNQDVASAFMGISISISNALISSAAGHSEENVLDIGIPIYYRAALLHYRMMQKYIAQVEKSDLYAKMLDRFAFLSCLGVYLGDENATLLCKEYTRHIDSGFHCPFSVDKTFMSFCYNLAKWYLDGKANFTNEDSSGIYNGLFEHKADKLILKISEVLDARVESAYLQLVKNKNIEPTFYNTEFTALFPFEILAFIKLAGIGLNSVEHPLLAPFMGRNYKLPDSYKERFDRCAEKIATL